MLVKIEEKEKIKYLRDITPIKRFIIEEMFRDLKSNGFDMEGTWTEDIVYFKNLYLCLSIAYTWMIILGADCSKTRKVKL